MNDLIEKYPNFFKLFYTRSGESFQELSEGAPFLSCQAWGFECGPGWKPLIEKVAQACEESEVDIYATQIKEKYGTLRIYTNGGTDEIFDLIDEVEDESEKMCEVCGEAGQVVGTGWLKCRCQKCLDEEDGRSRR